MICPNTTSDLFLWLLIGCIKLRGPTADYEFSGCMRNHQVFAPRIAPKTQKIEKGLTAKCRNSLVIECPFPRLRSGQATWHICHQCRAPFDWLPTSLFELRRTGRAGSKERSENNFNRINRIYRIIYSKVKGIGCSELSITVIKILVPIPSALDVTDY